MSKSFKENENVKSSVQKEHKVNSQVTVFPGYTIIAWFKGSKSFSDGSSPPKHAASETQKSPVISSVTGSRSMS